MTKNQRWEDDAFLPFRGPEPPPLPTLREQVFQLNAVVARFATDGIASVSAAYAKVFTVRLITDFVHRSWHLKIASFSQDI